MLIIIETLLLFYGETHRTIRMIVLDIKEFVEETNNTWDIDNDVQLSFSGVHFRIKNN